MQRVIEWARRAARGRHAVIGRVLVALAGVALLPACGEQGVVRVYDAESPTRGRFISEYAYALYAQGAEAEMRGDYPAAARAFEAAAAEDGPNAEVWTRVGAVRCTSADGVPRAEAAFERARTADPSYEPMHRERARCLLRLGRATEALEEARTALVLDPEREDTSLVLAEAAERAGRAEEGVRVLYALVVARPGSVAAATALRDASVRLGLGALAERSDERLERLGARDGDPSASAQGAARSVDNNGRGAVLAAIDAALLRGDGAEASRFAHRARLGPSELAVRAAALGQARVAREEAELVLGADPADGSARIAAAVAGDALGETDTIERALALPARAVTPPSALARLLLAELIDRRAGRDAARAYLGPDAALVADADPLYARTAERVRARLRDPAAEHRAARAP